LLFFYFKRVIYSDPLENCFLIVSFLLYCSIFENLNWCSIVCSKRFLGVSIDDCTYELESSLIVTESICITGTFGPIYLKLLFSRTISLAYFTTVSPFIEKLGVFSLPSSVKATLLILSITVSGLNIQLNLLLFILNMNLW